MTLLEPANNGVRTPSVDTLQTFPEKVENRWRENISGEKLKL